MRRFIHSTYKIVFNRLFPVFIRTDAFFCFENFSKIIIIGIAYHLGNFLQCMIRLCHKQAASLRDTEFSEIFSRRDSVFFMEFFAQGLLGHAGMVSYQIQVQILHVVILIYKSFGMIHL